MGLFTRKKPVAVTPEILNKHLDECRERVQILQQVDGSLVFSLKELDSSRIDSLSKEISVLRTSMEQVKDASQMDAVTGSSNRMTLDSQMQRMIQRSHIVWNPLSFMMCDLDNFKLINDTHGHLVGDRVLKCFVQECKAMFRSDDFIARYGGEEFAVLLPGSQRKRGLTRKIDLIPGTRIRFRAFPRCQKCRKGTVPISGPENNAEGFR